MKFRNLFYVLTLLPLLIPLAASSQQVSVLKVSSQTAQGTTETGVQSVVLGTGQGINLSFLPVGETIQKVWLDDPTQVVLDFDGCLASNAIESTPDGNRAAASNGCPQESGASILHVRQLPEPIKFPVKTSTRPKVVQLTLVASGSGGRKIYQFQLVLGGQTPPYSTIEVIASPPPAPAQLVSVSAEYQATVLSQLSRGLAYAESKQIVDRSSTAYGQLVSSVALMQKGLPFAKAIEQTGVPLKLVDRIRAYASQR